ncbi:carotenoid biosynthesis protein [Chitinophaga niabensis]|uniref:Carotenoid biosynthesis protein n=1 Tax=Chitinophaga niabensis TaxID=536979 RepID=A0A1N6JNP7_9BACT|nr:carotenoid biosynthesis protein [Chitinophaga niabensis]SIO45863.1 Protein of unknown function [Chitinophaga niabensis]
MLPFRGMPYGYPPGFCYPLTEICMYILFLLCCRHAWKKGPGSMAYLLGGLGFGLLLEYVNVSSSGAYVYGKFMVMFGSAPNDIPLCIGMGWAVIMYTARLITDALGIPLWAAAAIDTLLAINIDLSMDVVAYRLHMWHWDWEGRTTVADSLTGQWFGIPYGNFYGWLLVVFYYSVFARLLEKSRWTKFTAWRISIPLLSILISQVALYISLFPLADWLKTFGVTSMHRFVALLVVFSVMAVIGCRKRIGGSVSRLPLVTWLVPGWFHVYFTCWFFGAGFYLENQWMTFWCIANLCVGVVMHILLHRHLSRKYSNLP